MLTRLPCLPALFAITFSLVLSVSAASQPPLIESAPRISYTALPAAVAPAIAQSLKLQETKQFAEALALLEARRKERGRRIAEPEKRALLIATADVHYYWAEMLRQNSLYGSGDKGTLRHYQKAYEIEGSYRPKRAVNSLYRIIGLYEFRGYDKKVLEYQQKMLSLRQKNGEQWAVALTLDDIGDAYRSLKQPEKAIKAYRKALLLYQQQKEEGAVGMTLRKIGLAYDSLGQTTNALAAYQNAVSLPPYDEDGLIQSLNRIGFIYYSLGDTDNAIKFYNNAISLFRSISFDPSDKAAAVSGIAVVYESLDQKAKAVELYNQVLAIEDVRPADVAAALNRLVTLYDALGEKEKAREAYKEFLIKRYEARPGGTDAPIPLAPL